MSDMTRGGFLKGMAALLAGAAATAAAAEACSPEPALALQAAPQDTIEIPVSYMLEGRALSGTVSFTPTGELVGQKWDSEHAPQLSASRCARLWENARALRRSYDP